MYLVAFQMLIHPSMFIYFVFFRILRFFFVFYFDFGFLSLLLLWWFLFRWGLWRALVWANSREYSLYCTDCSVCIEYCYYCVWWMRVFCSFDHCRIDFIENELSPLCGERNARDALLILLFIILLGFALTRFWYLFAYIRIDFNLVDFLAMAF